MSGFNLIRKIKYLEEECQKLGFEICQANHYIKDFGDVLALKPKADCLPIYSRDAELFVGTIADLERWLQGFHFARKYDSMLLGIKHDAARDRKEQDYRNKQLIKKIKGEEQEYEQA